MKKDSQWQLPSSKLKKCEESVIMQRRHCFMPCRCNIQRTSTELYIWRYFVIFDMALQLFWLEEHYWVLFGRNKYLAYQTITSLVRFKNHCVDWTVERLFAPEGFTNPVVKTWLIWNIVDMFIFDLYAI